MESAGPPSRTGSGRYSVWGITDVDVPQARYARTPEGVHIAYQVIGDGPTDILFPGLGYSNIEFIWRLPAVAHYLRRLAGIGRVILFDPRGMGLSDPLDVERLPTLETRMADALAVLDAAGSERAAVMGMEGMAPLAVLFAATHPDRTAALMLFGPTNCGSIKPDYPWTWSDEDWQAWHRDVETGWGDPRWVREYLRPFSPAADDDAAVQAWAAYYRVAASPGTVAAIDMMERATDVRHVLPLVQAPTLVVHYAGDQMYAVEEGRYAADHIPGARFVELEGNLHWPWDGDVENVVSLVRESLPEAGEEEPELDRVLATVLFTDIVDSTAVAAQVGDSAWRGMLAEHDRLARALVSRYRGVFCKSTGDGLMATFDGPARAVRCAQALCEAVQPLGIKVRSGTHTGEVTFLHDDIAGLGVHVAARVAAQARGSEVWASSTVKDLTAGSGLAFEDRGEHELKGVPDRWRLYRVVG